MPVFDKALIGVGSSMEAAGLGSNGGHEAVDRVPAPDCNRAVCRTRDQGIDHGNVIVARRRLAVYQDYPSLDGPVRLAALVPQRLAQTRGQENPVENGPDHEGSAKRCASTPPFPI